jgi:hypothetical protein
MLVNNSFWTNPEKYVENLLRKKFSRKASVDCHKGNIYSFFNIFFLTILEKYVENLYEKSSQERPP